jgi:hypothetical protein
MVIGMTDTLTPKIARTLASVMLSYAGSTNPVLEAEPIQSTSDATATPPHLARLDNSAAHAKPLLMT